MIEQPVVEVYADGGVIGANPSAIGGTWAWCHVNALDERIRCESGVVRPWGTVTHITNNLSELIALVLGIEALPEGWTGTIYSDSRVTLGRVFEGWKMQGVPAGLIKRADMARGRLGAVRYVLLDGHPSRAQLAAGEGKRGNPVSIHNVWCDQACSRKAQGFQ